MKGASAVLSSVAYLALYHFYSALSHKRHYFRKRKVTGHKICVLISSTNSSISHSKKI